jgi:CBS domain-containing protein
MTAGELCTRSTVVVKEDQTIGEAARLMKQYNVGCVVIIRSQSGHSIPHGILTDRDIVMKAMQNGEPISSAPLGSAMSSPAISVKESTSLFEALRKMHYNGIRRILVVNDAGHLTGILSLDDILYAISNELHEITGIFRKEEPVI